MTSDSWEDTNGLLTDILVPLANALNTFFAKQSYGNPERFMVVVVAVDSDLATNERIAKKYNKIGNERHPATGERVRYIGIALPFDPVAILSHTVDENRIIICDSIIRKMNDPGFKIPREFNYSKFVSDLNVRLEILKRANF